MNTSAAALVAVRAFRSSTLTNKKTWVVNSRTFVSTSPQKASGKPTSGGTAESAHVNLQGKNLDPPSNIFKSVDASALGPGASKQSNYKNPEYFSYHNMSYTEMELVMAKFRVPQPSNNKK